MKTTYKENKDLILKWQRPKSANYVRAIMFHQPLNDSDKYQCETHRKFKY